MVRLKKLFLLALVALTLAILPACAPGQQAAQTTPTVDLNAVMTSAAATAFVQLTEIAAAPTPTLEPTAAPPTAETAPAATDVLAPEATATTGVVPVETPIPAQPTATSGVPENTPVVPGITPIPSATPVVAQPTNTGPLCLNSAFVEDVTIPDGTVLKPWEKFYKVWRIQNTGTCTWDEGFGFVSWSAGPPSMGGKKYFSAGEKLAAGGIVDIGIEMYAPGDPGEYVVHWVMVDDKGKTFGGDFVVAIKVVK